MLRALFVAAFLTALAAPARADIPSPAAVPAPVLDDPSPGNGAILALSVFTMSSLSSTFGIATVSTGSAFPSLQPLVSIGYQASQVAILVGFGFGAVGGTGGTNVGGTNFGSTGTTFLASISPTIRYYMRPLQAGSFSPFVEGTAGFGVAGSNPDIAFLFDVGFGGEYLFVKNFGLFGRAMVGYEHANFGSNVDGIGVAGDVGLTVHL